MNIVSTVGIELAKNVFSVHGVDASGIIMIRRTVTRAKLTELVAQLPPCRIGMEACSGAHEWARRLPPSATRRELLGQRADSAKPKDLVIYLRRAPKVAPVAGDERDL